MQNSLWLNTVLSSVEVVSVQWRACMYWDIIVSYALPSSLYVVYNMYMYTDMLSILDKCLSDKCIYLWHSAFNQYFSVLFLWSLARFLREKNTTSPEQKQSCRSCLVVHACMETLTLLIDCHFRFIVYNA